MMLSRAAVRSIAGARVAAHAASPLLSQRTLPAVWTRSMAKDNKPPKFSKPESTPAQKATPKAPEPAESEKAEQKQQQQQQQQQQTPAESESEPEPEIDLSKLPDLRGGIPTTLEYEMAQKEAGKKPVAGEEAETQAEGAEGPEAATSGSGGGGRKKGQLPDSAYVSSTEKRRQKMANWAFIASGLALVGGTIYLGREWDEEELEKHHDIPNGWGLGLWWKRAKARMTGTVSYYQEPAFEKLLPDPDPSFERPYTLCISLEDMLVHSEWTRDHGWRLAKRPGVDYFLRYLSQYYEIVLFTSVPFANAEPIVRKMDPYRFIMWPLFREATKYKDGEIVKDLSYLNRDLSKVIIIDTDPKHVCAQPENAIVLPKWKGDPKDTELVSLVPFLEFIHTMNFPDVRKVLKSFEGQHIPTEFARREAIARAEHNKLVAAKAKKAGLGSLGARFGIKPSKLNPMAMEGEEDPSEAFAKGKMIQDIARERGMRNYLAMEEEIKKNGEMWLKMEQEAQEKAQKEMMKNMQSSVFGWFGGAPSGEQQSGESEKKA
ncbi:mitochondrial import inner membrane translocase subunit tim-50 [Neurospora tetrasperma FGSC 2509]|nr:mitochondrial import inner membrane translocase subunit tim-50 [Neurospora tetrasperma FGSC 2509]